MASVYPPVGATVGRYRISGVLGHGGMGIVYAAVREDLDRKVALKVLSPELADEPGFRRRFAREAQILSSLYSPHIIDIYDYGEHDSCLFIATPLITGGDLRRYLVDRGALTPHEALRVAEQVGEALTDAHRAGVVHRDIKPSNVLLHLSSDGEVFAYLGDFGIAHSPGDERTPTDGLTGTLSYMAPERHTGSSASIASDLYALGCLLFAMLTGGPPYDGTDAQVAMQHLRAPVPLYAGGGVVAGAVNAVLQRAMAKDPADRYGSAEEMHADLKSARLLVEAHAEEDLVPAPHREEPGRAAVLAAPERATAGRRGLHGRKRVTSAPSWVVGVVALAALGGVGAYAWSQQPRACEEGVDASGECRDPDQVEPQPEGTFTCWDGSPVDRRSQCTTPAGMRGLLWVFPSLRRDLETCERRVDPTIDASLRSWRCEPTDGTPGMAVHYTEWLSSEAAAGEYESQFAMKPVNFTLGGRAAGYRWWWTEPNGQGLLKMSVAYLHLPFSASVYAESSAGLDAMCAGVVARSPHTFRGEPLECDRPAQPSG
jgi:hypothetical protein